MDCRRFAGRPRPCRRAAVARSRPGRARAPLRSGRRPAQPQPALLSPRTPPRSSSSSPAWLSSRSSISTRDGRPHPSSAGRDPDPRQRRALRRWADDPYRLRRGVRVERRAAGDRGGRALHAARDSGSAQPGALARRLRSDRPRRAAPVAHTVVFHLKRAWAPAVDDLFLVRLFAAVRAAGARLARAGAARARCVQRRARPSATDPIVFSFGGAARGYGTRLIRATGAVSRRSRSCRSDDSRSLDEPDF